MWRDAASLTDILRAAHLVVKFTSGLAYPQFLEHEMAQAAVIRQLEIIGEAARRISEETKEAHAEIPWPVLIALRNLLIHEYDRVSLARIWEIASLDVPDLIRVLDPLVPPEE